jgi:hypothetical protein
MGIQARINYLFSLGESQAEQGKFVLL